MIYNQFKKSNFFPERLDIWINRHDKVNCKQDQMVSLILQANILRSQIISRPCDMYLYIQLCNPHLFCTSLISCTWILITIRWNSLIVILWWRTIYIYQGLLSLIHIFIIYIYSFLIFGWRYWATHWLDLYWLSFVICLSCLIACLRRICKRLIWKRRLWGWIFFIVWRIILIFLRNICTILSRNIFGNIFILVGLYL